MKFLKFPTATKLCVQMGFTFSNLSIDIYLRDMDLPAWLGKAGMYEKNK